MRSNELKAQLGCIAIILCLSSTFSSNGYARDPKGTDSPITKYQEAPLGNADIIKLTKLDLGDEVVIAKINQAKIVKFDLGTDALIDLKKNGVSKDVISAMLKISTSRPQATSGASINSVPTSVFLKSSTGEIKLAPYRGETKLVHAFVTVLRFQEYPSMSAKIRINDPRPSILVPLQEDPKRSMAYLVKLESDQKSDTRSLKIGQGMMGAMSGLVGNDQDGGSPDSEWTVPYEASEDSPGMWRIVPKSNLVSGEYGYYYRGVLYDFGVVNN